MKPEKFRKKLLELLFQLDEDAALWELKCYFALGEELSNAVALFGEDVLPALHQKLQARRLQQHWVLVTLAKIASPRSIEPLIEFRNNRATEVDASLVAEALKRMKTGRAYEALLQFISTPESWLGSLEPLVACRALAEWKDERVVSVLASLAENPKAPVEVRAEAMKAVKCEY